jgi:hypothetical protein
MLILKIVILSFTILSVYGFETTKYGRRGTARIMTGLFSIQEESSSSSIQLDNTKRDRVTW